MSTKERELTDREMRRYERRLARNYLHQTPRRGRCSRWYCVRCWRDQILGRHRRELARMRARFTAQDAIIAACDHQWRTRKITGRDMLQCAECGLIKWVRA